MTVTSERQTSVVGRLSNIDKWYGSRQVLDDISLEIRTHEIVALVGRSGVRQVDRITGAGGAFPRPRR